MFVILITLTRFEDTLVVSCLHTMTILLWINAVFIFALIKLPRIWNTYTIPVLPTYVGGKRKEEKLSMLPEDIGNFSP